MSLSARATYRQTALETAPKSTLLVQLYERLEQDLTVASEAIDLRDYEVVNVRMIHAQDIVTALAGSLDVALWPDGAGLLSLYEFLLAELTIANIEKSRDRVDSCRAMVHELTDAWRGASGGGSGGGELIGARRQ